MKCQILIFFVLFTSSVHAEIAVLSPGEDLAITVNGCENDEQVVVRVSENTVTGECVPATCRSVYHRASGEYNVYRCEADKTTHGSCEAEGNGELVGTYTSSVTPGTKERALKVFSLDNAIENDLTKYLKTSEDCSIIKLYRNAISGDVVVEKNRYNF